MFRQISISGLLACSFFTGSALAQSIDYECVSYYRQPQPVNGVLCSSQFDECREYKDWYVYRIFRGSPTRFAREVSFSEQARQAARDDNLTSTCVDTLAGLCRASAVVSRQPSLELARYTEEEAFERCSTGRNASQSPSREPRIRLP